MDCTLEPLERSDDVHVPTLDVDLIDAWLSSVYRDDDYQTTPIGVGGDIHVVVRERG